MGDTVDVHVEVVRNASEIAALMTGPNGDVARDLMRRANRVVNKARSLVPVDTGILKASIKAEPIKVGSQPAVRIGSNVPYALYVHEGTGIYGRGAPIRPRNGQFLRWPATKGNAGFRRYQGGSTARYVYAREVRGMKGTPYLLNALDAAAD